jgi:signal transduction histidine kinase
LTNKKRILPPPPEGSYLNKVIHFVKSSIRIEVILAFSFCILVSLIAGFASSPFFVNTDRRLDFTEGIVTIDESARNLVIQFNQVNQDLYGLITALGDEDPSFKNKFLNRSLPSVKGNDERLTVPNENNSSYQLTKKELIQYLINTPKQQNNINVLISDFSGKVLFKSEGVTDTHVDLKNVMRNAEKAFVGRDHVEHPTITRVSQITLNGEKNYLIVNGVPKSTAYYVQETGVTPYLIGLVTFILCFYLITKRKMNEIEEIALGLMEIAKGNLNYRIREKSKDELGSLATNINYMASELNEMIEKQRQTEKLKDELITNVSHDLRTPLTSVMGYLRLVKDHQYKNQEQLDEYVDIAYGKSEQLKKLIEDLFEFTRLTYEGERLKKEKVSLNQMLIQLMDELEPIAKENHVSFSNDLPKEQLLMVVDPNKMVRALENIFMNAIKYSIRPGNIHVEMVKNNNYVQISVSNPCESLSQDEVIRLFDRFYRVDTARSSNKSGAGLGLAITKSIIESHQGTIHVDYKNKIIRITISLPFNSNKG